MDTSYSTPAANRLSIGLAILRVVAGIVFVAHGWQKLFVMGISGVTNGFTQMGIPLPEITAPAIAILEFAGGIALILGLLTHVVAALFALDMLGAILFVHLPNGFFLPQGYEFAFTLLGISASLAAMGAGAYSADALLGRRRVAQLRS
jgi:putative oxidoreductase